MITVLCNGQTTTLPQSHSVGEALWVPLDRLEDASGWTLEAEGLCHGEVCVPLPQGRGASLLRDNALDLSGFWRHMGKPVVHSADGSTWLLGDAGEQIRQRLSMLEAPDLALPDLEGRVHALKDYRGTKVFLVAWASW